MALVDIELILNGDFDMIFDEITKESSLKIAIKAVANAKVLAPVNKIKGQGGRLRNSIMWKDKNTSGGLNDSSGEKASFKVDENVTKNGEVIVGLNLNYGIYQEFGTRKMAPQPFLRPSIAIAQGADSVEILKKINEEVLRGKLKKGQKRENFK